MAVTVPQALVARFPVGANVAFFVVFGAFIVAFAVLSVITVTWALRRDRAGRAEWLRRQGERRTAPGRGSPPPKTNGWRPPAEGGGRGPTP